MKTLSQYDLANENFVRVKRFGEYWTKAKGPFGYIDFLIFGLKIVFREHVIKLYSGYTYSEFCV